MTEKIYTGGAAFPCLDAGIAGLSLRDGGMTLRDYFAAKAMAAMYTASFEWEPTGFALEPHHMAIMEEMAMDAYGIADAMLKAREQ